MNFFETFWEGVMNTPLLEWLAVFCGVAYVILAAMRSMLCWLFALISSGIYIYIFFTVGLYLESSLQLFYVVMAVVGFFSWRSAGDPNTAHNVPIKTWHFSAHFINIVVSGVVALTLGLIFDVFTDQKSPYMDAFTTVYSLAATFMVTQRVLENWIYWIVIDLVSIVLYSSRGLFLSSVLYLLFTILAVVGFISWYRQLKVQTA